MSACATWNSLAIASMSFGPAIVIALGQVPCQEPQGLMLANVLPPVAVALTILALAFVPNLGGVG
jgi:hypothetical protein